MSAAVDVLAKDSTSFESADDAIELPNPDPLIGRPANEGRDRCTCIEIRDVSQLKAILDKAGDFLHRTSFCMAKEQVFISFPCKAA
ncbi:hypothetical protein RHMOL_Rhmol05G0014700 [Rhododendron molle]|uniref:Uncharacterized protein n=1 Tax=Rhododendron molle TaxID=49168 RepID=A0ACC0NJN0_RHOML|nr:hypothetical protein RHMOL_Rhmol05G0014700 [Rhododendron molle]